MDVIFVFSRHFLYPAIQGLPRRIQSQIFQKSIIGKLKYDYEKHKQLLVTYFFQEKVCIQIFQTEKNLQDIMLCLEKY